MYRDHPSLMNGYLLVDLMHITLLVGLAILLKILDISGPEAPDVNTLLGIAAMIANAVIKVGAYLALGYAIYMLKRDSALYVRVFRSTVYGPDEYKAEVEATIERIAEKAGLPVEQSKPDPNQPAQTQQNTDHTQ